MSPAGGGWDVVGAVSSSQLGTGVSCWKVFLICAAVHSLHLIKVRVPRLSVVLLPGIGVQLTVGAKLQLRGNW